MGTEDSSLFDDLLHRIGRDHLSRRLGLQVDHSARYFGNGAGRFHWENSDLMPNVLGVLLKFSGLLRRGERNAAACQVVAIDAVLKRLPEAFENFRILQLSDIHIDGMADLGERIIGLIKNLEYDLCVFTGDFRFRTFGSFGPALEGMKRLAASIKCRHGILAILGNHDFVEMVPELESCGIRMLLNETAAIERDGKAIHIVGLDDAHFYGTADLEKTMANLPAGDFKLLLVHSPEIIPQAARAGVDYYLCGHTHGGQICLPGNIPLLTNAACSRTYVRGAWTYGAMTGYTSRGTGSSGLAVRFHCPPELTLHRLTSRPLPA